MNPHQTSRTACLLISINILLLSHHIHPFQTHKPKPSLMVLPVLLSICGYFIGRFLHLSFVFFSSYSHSSSSSIARIQALSCLCAKLDCAVLLPSCRTSYSSLDTRSSKQECVRTHSHSSPDSSASRRTVLNVPVEFVGTPAQAVALEIERT